MRLPCGHHLATGGSDKTLRILDLDKKRYVFTGEGHKAPIHSVTFSANGEFCVSAGGDVHEGGGEAILWSVKKKESLLHVKDLMYPIYGACFVKGEEVLAL